jgi:hypothetical protein
MGSPFVSAILGKKKADVVESPQGFDHVGLLLDEPPGPAGLPFVESSDEFVCYFTRLRCDSTPPPESRLYSGTDESGK